MPRTPCKYYNPCKKCDGTGTFAPPAERRGNGWTQRLPGRCEDCHGTGDIPTEEGREILLLVRRFATNTRVEIPLD